MLTSTSANRTLVPIHCQVAADLVSLAQYRRRTGLTLFRATLRDLGL